MAQNPYVNKVQTADGSVIMDISNDTVTSSDVLNGVTFHDRSGTPQTGSVITHNVYDGLDSTSTDDALSAKQGKALNDHISKIHPTSEVSNISEMNSLLTSVENGKYITFFATNVLYNELTGINKSALITAFKSTTDSDYIEYMSIDYDGDSRSGSYKISTGGKSVYASSIRLDSVTGSTSANGNLSKQLSNKYRILSAWSTTGGHIVNAYPQSGADEYGNYTWWFHVCSDAANMSVVANTQVTIWFTYIRV